MIEISACEVIISLAVSATLIRQAEAAACTRQWLLLRG